MAKKRSKKQTLKAARAKMKAPLMDSPGYQGWGVFVVADEARKLWRIDADAGTARPVRLG